MEKALLLSILVAMIALPATFASDPNPRRGLNRTIVSFALFNAFYLFSLLFVWPHLVD